jgi:hypothetical protein
MAFRAPRSLSSVRPATVKDNGIFATASNAARAPGVGGPAELKALLAPYPPCWPVSPRVGNVKKNDPNLIEPIATSFPNSI